MYNMSIRIKKICILLFLCSMFIQNTLYFAISDITINNDEYSEYVIDSDSYIYTNVNNDSLFIFQNNIKSYIQTNNYSLSIYMEVDSKMNNHEFLLNIKKNNSFIETYLNSTDEAYGISHGKVYRDSEMIRYVFNSKFSIYTSNNESYSFFYKTENRNYYFFSVVYNEYTYEFEFAKADSNYYNGYLSINVNPGTSYYFIVEKDEITTDVIFIVGTGLGIMSFVGLGIIFKDTKKETKTCLPPKEMINGECTDWDTYFKRNPKNL